MNYFTRNLNRIKVLSLTVIIISGTSYGQGYSNLGIWNDRGVWVGLHGGAAIPVGRLMSGYLSNGYSSFISFDFPQTFFNIGIESGIQRFYKKNGSGSVDIIPINAFLNLNLLSLKTQLHARQSNLKIGLGGGAFINKSEKKLKYLLGIYVPIMYQYQFTKRWRIDLEARGYEVFGDITSDTGTDDYLDIHLSFQYFIMY